MAMQIECFNITYDDPEAQITVFVRAEGLYDAIERFRKYIKRGYPIGMINKIERTINRCIRCGCPSPDELLCPQCIDIVFHQEVEPESEIINGRQMIAASEYVRVAREIERRSRLADIYGEEESPYGVFTNSDFQTSDRGDVND